VRQFVVNPRFFARGTSFRSPRLIGVCVSAFTLDAADWPQYRGPNHDGTSTEPIRIKWSAQPPRQVWKVPLEPALSSLSIRGGRVFTQVRRSTGSGPREFCVALNADTWTLPPAITFGTALSSAQLNASAAVAGTFAYVPSSGTVLNAGQYALTVTFTPDDTESYQSTGATTALTVLKADQSISLGPLSDRRLTESPLMLHATSSSGLPVSLSVSGPATLSANALTLTGHGSVLVIATQPGNSNYNAAPTLQRLFEVIPNSGPSIEPITTQTIDEGNALNFFIRAKDSDSPAQILTYSLVGTIPAGASLDPSTGAFTWTPTEAQGPGVFNFTVRVTDNGTPAENSSLSFLVIVNEVNTAPVMAAIPAQTVPAGRPVSFKASASDADLPANVIKFRLGPGAPDTASIDEVTGVFTWTPRLSLDTTTNTVTIEVTDNGVPSLTASQPVTVIVTPSNLAPILQPIVAQTVAEGSLLKFTLAAQDPDTPPHQIFFVLEPGAPAGANLDPALGEFTWTPTEAQGPSTNVISFRVFDDGVPSQSILTNFTVIVTEVNEPPMLAAIADRTVTLGETVAFNVIASDNDVPAQRLAFSLDANAPAGASIHPDTGAFAWTPTSAQAGVTHRITARVTDNGTPSLSLSQSFSVTVQSAAKPPPKPVSDLRFDPIGGFRFRVTAPEGKQARLQVSADLVKWTDLDSAPVAGTAEVQDPQSPGLPFRFYRLFIE